MDHRAPHENHVAGALHPAGEVGNRASMAKPIATAPPPPPVSDKYKDAKTIFIAPAAPAQQGQENFLPASLFELGILDITSIQKEIDECHGNQMAGAGGSL